MTTPAHVRWLTPEQLRDWRTVLHGHSLMLERLDRDLRDEHGLSLGEYEILVRLSEAPDRSVRMSQLASYIGHSRSRVTHTVARLEQEGLVARQPCPDDRRGVEARLTDLGLARLEEAVPTHVRGVREVVIDNVSTDELGLAAEVYRRIGRALGTEDPGA